MPATTTLLRPLGVFALLICASVACSSSSTNDAADGSGEGGEGDDDDDGADVEADTKDAAREFCEFFADCFPVYAEYAYGDVDRCVAQLSADARVAREAPDSAQTAETQAACYRAQVEAGCKAWMGRVPDVCIVPGGRAPGEACYSGSQCAAKDGSPYCYQTSEEPCGICAGGRGIGESCDLTNPEKTCASGLYCDQGKNTCAAPARTGKACTDTQLCQAGSWCVDGKCEAQPTEAGAACDGIPCNTYTGMYCDQSTKKCKTYEIVPTGKACDVAHTLCENAGSCIAGKCRARGGKGDACDPKSQKAPLCGTGLVCVEERCVAVEDSCR